MHTLRGSGLAHEAEVYLQIRETFEVEQKFLIALRDSSHFEDWKEEEKAGWVDLDEFAEPQQLSACAGVAVGDGEITALDLTRNHAIERKLLSNSCTMEFCSYANYSVGLPESVGECESLTSLNLQSCGKLAGNFKPVCNRSVLTMDLFRSPRRNPRLLEPPNIGPIRMRIVDRYDLELLDRTHSTFNGLVCFKGCRNRLEN